MTGKTKESIISEIVFKYLKDLNDETIIHYIINMVNELEEYNDLKDCIGPFLISSGYVEDEDEMIQICTDLKNDIENEFNINKINNNKKEEIIELLNATVISDLARAQEESICEMTDSMWGFEKIRQQKNEQMTNLELIQSQRQIRKQIKNDRIQAEKEMAEAEEDREWEDTKILPIINPNDPKIHEKDIHVDNITLSFKGMCLLKDTSLKLIDGRKYGLIGKNGAGKTTLLRFMSKYELDKFPRHVRIQHVEQESASKLSLATDKSVLDIVLASDYERKMLLDKEKLLNSTNTNINDKNDKELKQIYERLTEIDSDSVESRARSILYGLQFTEKMIIGPAAALSGGWRMRVALAGALLMSPDLLLLDEPTNHLDLEAVVWLEDYLVNHYKKTVVIVSHDRHFLDTVVTDCIHLHNLKLNYYKGDYTNFESTVKELYRTEKKLYDAQQLYINHVQTFIDRFRCNAKKAALVQSRIKQLQKLEILEEPEDPSSFTMHFPPPEPLNRPIITLNNVCFSYEPRKNLLNSNENINNKCDIKENDGEYLLENVDFGIDLSSRIGVLGANGAGKSTLINILLKKLKVQKGEVYHNSKVRIAVFTQHAVDQLDLSKSAVENMMTLYPGHDALQFRSHLGRFNVSGDMAIKPTRKLSGGQKSRVGFAMLTWNLPHILVMDEPTNHLDLETIDALVNALNEYKGGVLIVSHDEHFVSNVCKELWVVTNKKVEKFNGNMEDYKRKILI